MFRLEVSRVPWALIYLFICLSYSYVLFVTRRTQRLASVPLNTNLNGTAQLFPVANLNTVLGVHSLIALAMGVQALAGVVDVEAVVGVDGTNTWVGG